MTRPPTTLAAIVSLASAVGCLTSRASSTPTVSSPEAAAASLLAADRGYARDAASRDLPTALTAMMADSVVMPAPGGRFARGVADVAAALRTNPANAASRASWAPLRVGVSGDGAHGFTYGYFTVTRADGPRQDGKYVAYWVRGDRGWRVLAYKRAPRPAGVVATDVRASALPGAKPAGSASAQAGWVAELREAERGFSREAQQGFAAAFRANAAPDAAHLGGPADAAFRFGPDEIAAGVAAGGEPSAGQVTWEPEEVHVSPAGDLGVSIGYITFQGPTGAQRTPFFTIWRRDEASGRWRFVIE